MIALDASALLAFLFREEGHEEVGRRIHASCLSTVNLSEVLGRFTRDGHDSRPVLEQIGATSIEIVPFSEEHAAIAAELAPKTRKSGLALGDRACLALALSRGIDALTADQAWSRLDTGVRVRVVRPRGLR
jgi:PIN domain nuclease of toxin-antitoxin system